MTITAPRPANAKPACPDPKPNRRDKRRHKKEVRQLTQAEMAEATRLAEDAHRKLFGPINYGHYSTDTTSADVDR